MCPSDVPLLPTCTMPIFQYETHDKSGHSLYTYYNLRVNSTSVNRKLKYLVPLSLFMLSLSLLIVVVVVLLLLVLMVLLLLLLVTVVSETAYVVV